MGLIKVPDDLHLTEALWWRESQAQEACSKETSVTGAEQVRRQEQKVSAEGQRAARS